MEAEQGEQPRLDGEQLVDAEDGEVVQVPQPHPEPRPPTARERASHALNHFPYRSWCKHCVAGRRNNAPHFARHPEDRSVPALHLDYCFPKDNRDTVAMTCLVGVLTPSGSPFACDCASKGVHDPYVVHRLKDFFKASGSQHLVCKSDCMVHTDCVNGLIGLDQYSSFQK